MSHLTPTTNRQPPTTNHSLGRAAFLVVPQVVDAVDASGDNGSCDCEIFCAADWAGAVKAARYD